MTFALVLLTILASAPQMKLHALLLLRVAIGPRQEHDEEMR
jgi:hypothetical protein